tara:strand:- start:1164 stop:1640 length:477 start_codon:yes stop_codon:yes gene_type:complete
MSEINNEFWWESIDEYIMSEINEFESALDEYYGYLQILFIDEHDVEDENSGGMRFHKILPYEDIDELEPWIGKKEVKKWKSSFNDLSEEKINTQHETALYVSNENGYEFLSSLTIDKINFMETLETDCDECFDTVMFCDSSAVDDDDWTRICNNCKKV